MRQIIAWILVLAALLLTGCGPAAPAASPSPAATGTSAPTAAATPDPTATPTATPVPTPTPISDEALAAGALDAYFDDAVFVGDSFTRNLNSYVITLRETAPGFLGGARFLTAHSFSLKYATKKSPKVALSYRGKAVTIAEGLAQMEAGRVFILLGLNDYVAVNVEKCLGYCKTIIADIREKNPDIEIIFEAPPPVRPKYRKGKGQEYSGKLGEYRDTLEAFCDEQGVLFLDLYTAFLDADGCLEEQYCSDGKCHLNDAGNEIWIRLLREFAYTQWEQNGRTLAPAAGSAAAESPEMPVDEEAADADPSASGGTPQAEE